MTPQELKNSILQLAIQGKLVEQRPEEGTAEELYRQIQEEKRRLVTEGKIKKEKPLPEIAEDEIPFEIPEKWKWIRLSQLVLILNGDRGKNYPAKSTLSHAGIPFISALNLDGKSVVGDDNLLRMSEQQYERLGNGKLIKDDIVVCIRGSLGKHGRYPFDRGAIASSLVILRPFLSNRIIAEFLMMYLDTPLFFYEIQKYDNGTAQPNLAAKNLEQFIFPLPPHAEQKRIVAKIEEFLPYIDRYEQAWNRLEDFNKRFPIDMQKSLLQWAIQGKLVEQRAEEGTAEGIYPEIQGEPPFDIPQNWKWVRLSDIIVEKPSNGFSPKGVNYETKVKNLTLTATTSGKFKPDAFKYVDIDLEPDSKYWLKKGDLLIQRSNSRELVGTSCVYTGKDNEYIYPDLMMKLRVKDGINVFYVDYVLKAPLSRFYFSKNASGTSESMPKINQRIVSDTLIPLPPLAEQKRIVAKLEELLPLCERLK